MFITDIVDKLYDDLKTKFGKSENYKTKDITTTIYRGHPDNLDEGIAFPILGFTFNGGAFQDAFGRRSYDKAVVRFFGYAEVSESDPITSGMNLVYDLRYFLFNDFTYSDKISVFKDYIYNEGKDEIPSYFICSIEIIYDSIW